MTWNKTVTPNKQGEGLDALRQVCKNFDRLDVRVQRMKKAALFPERPFLSAYPWDQLACLRPVRFVVS